MKIERKKGSIFKLLFSLNIASSYIAENCFKFVTISVLLVLLACHLSVFFFFKKNFSFFCSLIHKTELISFPQLADDAFNTLLPSNRNDDFSMDRSTSETNHSTSSSDRSRLVQDHAVSAVHSDPISIPDSKQMRPSALNCERLPSTESIAAVSQSPAIAAPSSCNKGFSHLSCSPGCSSLDSFVFVDLKPPFAPDDQNELGSFFNGPSPSFGECSLAEEMEDLTDQLALMESNAQQWDQFVDSINLKSDDENE